MGKIERCIFAKISNIVPRRYIRSNHCRPGPWCAKYKYWCNRVHKNPYLNIYVILAINGISISWRATDYIVYLPTESDLRPIHHIAVKGARERFVNIGDGTRYPVAERGALAG